MSDYWSETISLFSNLLSKPPLTEKHLKRPSPKYLFFLIINTLKITDFPLGLFTEQEQTLEYFLKDRDNKIIFFKKIIELIELITKEKFDIDITNILKGKECDKTNKFLRSLYKIATNGIDYSKIIEKYLLDHGYDISWLKGKNDSGKGKNIFWLGKENDFKDLENYIKENEDYRFISTFKVKDFKNLNTVFDLMRTKNFEIVFIIITESLYADYYYKLKRYKNIIKCIPITIIYTSNIIQKKIKNHIKIHYFTEEVYSSINDSFFNFGGVSTDINSCLDFISNFSLTMKKEFNERKTPKSTFNGCITFEYVNSLNQLLVPILYNEMLNEETKVSDNEVQYFKYLLLNRHGEKAIANLIHPLLYVKDMPHEILAKFFTKAYTEQTTFYGEMNNSLMKKNVKEYEAFIRIMYEGLANKSLSISEDKELYRGSYMSKHEIENIRKKYDEYKEKGDKSLPAFLLYSRCFLSFSKVERVAKNFLGSNNDKAYAIFFVLKNNENVLNKYSSNADIENLSAFTSEKEVLFFPYTSFCLENITDMVDKNQDGKVIRKYVRVELEYIGRYDVALEKFKKNASLKNEFTEEFVDCFQEQNYSKELLNSNIIKVNKQIDKDIDAKKNYILDKLSNKIEEKYKIKVNKKSSGKKCDKYNDVIDVNESNKIQPKEEEKVVEEIKVEEKEIKVELNNKIFYINFSPAKYFTTMWKGNYNDDNQKHGKGKEYDIENNIIFEGECENGLKKEGKEFYYIYQKLKYEGNYQNDKWYDGKLYNIKNEEVYEIKSGNGIIKEFYENGNLYYEGELKDGKKQGKGKIYDINGSLIYDGKLINGIKNGKGKEYDEKGNLIFEGNFKSGKRMKIDVINKYNELGELIYRMDEIEENFLSIKDLKNHIMIKYGIWVMEKSEKKDENKDKNKNLNQSTLNSNPDSMNNLSKEREKIIFKKLKFEDEENDGKNGQVKEYDIINNLVFEGEYRNGKRYNGTNIIKMREKVYYFIIERGIFVQVKIEKINPNDLVYEGDCINGKGKILNIDGKILFIGEFRNGLKFKGKEFNSNKKLIFEGDYSEGGLIFNGKGKEYLDKELIFDGEYKEGYRYEGKLVKQYTKNHVLLYEGEYKEGFKSKGKEYYNHGRTKFDGTYKDEYYYKGKEYNYDTQLIFEGEYRNKKRWEGKGKEFNNKDKELIYEGDYQNGERTYGKTKIKKVVRTSRYNILFDGYFKDGYKYKGVEYNKSENYIFEGQYENGLKFRGKEYYFYKSDTLKYEGYYYNGLRSDGKEYDYGRLVFQGTFMNGKRFNGREYDIDNEYLIFEGDYENGERKRGKEYNEKGEIISSGEYKNGRIWTGNVKEFKDENNSIYSGEFSEGKFMNGQAKEYNENSCLIFNGEYKSGEKYNGIFYEYDDEGGQLLFIYKYTEGNKTILAKMKYEKDERSDKTLIYKISVSKLNEDNEIEEEEENLIFKGELKDGKIWNGTGKELDLDDEIVFEGEFKEGKRWKGKGKEFNSEDKLIFEGEYNNGKRWNGEGKEYNKKNILIYKGKYINGLNEKGLEYNYFEDENKKEEKEIDKEYDEDEQLIFEGELIDGIRHKGKEYLDGEIIYEGDYKDGLRWNGKGIEYDSENRKIFEGEIKERKKWKGKSNVYNSNGKLMFQRRYNDGMITKEIEYNSKGKKVFEGEYKNNEKYKGKEYNDIGEVIFEGEYRDNERFEGKAKNNLYEFNYINGKIESKNISVYDYINHELFIGEYKEGEKYNGILRTYFDEISYILKREVEVKEGNITGKGKEYYGNQKLKYEGQYENGKKNGEGILYFRFSGYINYIGNFKDGKKEGQGKEFDNWGNLVYEGLFSNDQRIN